jgi:hypothetical protein
MLGGLRRTSVGTLEESATQANGESEDGIDESRGIDWGDATALKRHRRTAIASGQNKKQL